MGCDEAGRGCIIGPMIIAGLAFRHGTRRKIMQLGVKDSKRLTPRTRERLYPAIKQLAERICVLRVEPMEIDKYVLFRGLDAKNLNTLEAEVMARIISRLRPHVAYIDCPDPVPGRFASIIRRQLIEPPHLICANMADETYPEVSASSIIAKVRRDRIVASLRRDYGDFGSGYPSDPKTRNFVREVIARGERPNMIRWSWKTIKRIQGIPEL